MTAAVIVAGHAILKQDAPDPASDDAWFLLPFQRGEGPCYVEHVRHGVELAALHPASLLIFSGGQTRAEAGPRSEAEGYLALARHYSWWGHHDVARRTTLEEFARDSFENLLFSLGRFQQHQGTWPAHATLVSWKFKAARFDLHRAAIGWPAGRFTFDGPNNPPELAQAEAAEALTLAAYRRDPYSTSAAFRAKKDARNPFRRQHPYTNVSHETKELFQHEGPRHYPGPHPW